MTYLKLLFRQNIPGFILIMCAAFFFSSTFSASASVCFSLNSQIAQTDNLRITVDDFLNLLEKGFETDGLCEQNVFINIEKAEAGQTGEEGYKWRQSSTGTDITVTLKAETAKGAVYGLYGLLQERLGYSFYHPRKTIFPNHAD